MITVNDVSLNFSGQTLFKHVDLKFTPGNCYGIIGANGAGKTTFLRILSGDLEPTTGEVVISKDQRMSVLKQDHFQYDQYTVLDTVIMGNQRLYDIMKEKDALYAKEDFTDEDGLRAVMRACRLEGLEDTCTHEDLVAPVASAGEGDAASSPSFVCGVGRQGGYVWSVIIGGYDGQVRVVALATPESHFAGVDLSDFGGSLCDYIAYIDLYTG